ncbi:ABC transporter permease [Maribellus mangrovi]|uniref:ABC transporter permease n=1 Tax=Maribellus mangrovi TaxID=3133146 RepID=UPI0030EC7823
MKQSIKLLIRNIRNKPLTYLINFVGLSVSLTLVFILSVYCFTEFSADTHHIDGDRIYFLYNEKQIDTYGGLTPGVLKGNIDLSVAEVQNTLRIRNSWLPATFNTEGRDPITTDLVYADESFFDFFNYKCLEGNLEKALRDPMSLVLEKSEAEKIFGTTKAVGETVLLNQKYPLIITAIIEPVESQSFLSVKAISPSSTIKIVNYDYSEGDYSNWGQRNFLTFVKLKKNSNSEQLSDKITSLFPEDYHERITMRLMPISKVYLHVCGLTKVLGFLPYIKQGNRSQLFILLVVAGLILFIALINYINISSSQRLETAKQTGLQKLIGANRRQIFAGIIAEAQFVFLGASILAFLISIAVIPFISDLMGLDIQVSNFLSPLFIGASMLSVILIGFLVCVVPAIRQSSVKSIDLIKDITSKGKRKFSLQRLNVAVQFSIAILLIAFTLFVFKQIKFGFSTVGFDDENRIAIKLNNQLYSKSDVLKEQILNLPEVSNASLTRFYPGRPGVNVNGGEIRGAGDANKKVEVHWMYADASILDVLNLHLLEGDFFRVDNPASGNKIVVNETFVREHGLSENPIGKTVYYSSVDHEIIGVVKDFHLNAVDVPIVPLVLTNDRPRNEFMSLYLLVNLKSYPSEDLIKIIEKIRSVSEPISPDYPVEISFLDAAVGEMYKSEVRFRRVFSLFAGSSIFISCLGIFALSLFDSRKRIKEIGIRKVNGARISEILTMLNKDFVKWVIIAFVIATPVAYYAMNKWLENFAYKTTLSWWIFALAGVLALGIALLTVSFQSYKAAVKNPVESLRYE